MVVTVLLCYHVKTSSFILEVNIFRITIIITFFYILVWIVAKQRQFYRSMNGRTLRTSTVRDAKVFFCLDDTCERKLVLFRTNRMCVCVCVRACSVYLSMGGCGNVLAALGL